MSGKKLIMDVGMYDGSDTAYYLKQGYRVVAIDANPDMIDAAKSRFNDAVNSGAHFHFSNKDSATDSFSDFYQSHDFENP